MIKVAITGSSGLAKSIADTLEATPHEGQTIKVSDIRVEDIIQNDTRCWIYDKENPNHVDVLINFAHKDFDQTNILEITHRAWKDDSSKFIINFSSRASEPNISKGYLYASQKSSLNHLSNNLTYNSSKQYKLTTLNLGLLDDEDLPSLSHQDVCTMIYYLITSFRHIEIPEITIQKHANYRDVQDIKSAIRDAKEFLDYK